MNSTQLTLTITTLNFCTIIINQLKILITNEWLTHVIMQTAIGYESLFILIGSSLLIWLSSTHNTGDSCAVTQAKDRNKLVGKKVSHDQGVVYTIRQLCEVGA